MRAGLLVKACVLCPVGSYKHHQNDVQCTLCPGGKYTMTIGTFECTACPANLYSSVGSVAKSLCLCNAGFSGREGVGCAKCIAGKYKITSGNTNCTLCDTDTYSTVIGATLNTCQACPLHTNAGIGAAVCCSFGMKAFADLTRCAPFQTNFIINVTDDYRAIFRSSNKAATALLTAATARQRVETTLVYDAGRARKTCGSTLRIRRRGRARISLQRLLRFPT